MFSRPDNDHYASNVIIQKNVEYPSFKFFDLIEITNNNTQN